MAPGIGASVFRRRRRGAIEKRYSIRIRMPDGRVMHRVGYTDKEATRQLAAQLVRELERKEMGLHDMFGPHRKAPIAEHLEAFLKAMENGSLARRRRGGRPSAEHIQRCRRRLQRLFSLMSTSRVEHLNAAAAEVLLVDLVRQGWSAKTRDDAAALLRQFGGWLVDDRRWPTNPFYRLRATATAATRTFRRHALTIAELQRLIEAAEVRSVQGYRTANPYARPETMERVRVAGWERGVLYQVAVYTGLRRKEITSLQWADVQLGGEPFLQLRAETTKNRRRARLELPRWLGQLLEQVRDRQALDLGGPPPPRAPVFRASYRHITELLKKDAAWAELGHLDQDGRLITEAGLVVDFHALRGTLATLAAEIGMAPKLLQQHMRHSDIRLTMDVYAQVRPGAVRDAIEQLPQPGSPPGSPAQPPSNHRDCRTSPPAEKSRRIGS